MTEKQYGGATSFGVKSTNSQTNNPFHQPKHASNKSIEKEIDSPESYLSKENISKLIKAGKIAREAITYAKSFIKPGMSLIEIAEKIESKIIELGGKPAFPVNLSKNEIAAHATPSFSDEEKAEGLLKVDLGVHIDGFVADTAFSLDLENNEENIKLIEAAESALKRATEKINLNAQINEIGEEIEEAIAKFRFSPIRNLSGHSIEQYDLHAGVTIPNFNNMQTHKLTPGVYAIEPFSTKGFGAVRDGKPSGIFHIIKEGNVRDSFAREVLAYIEEEYSSLPFCSRWIYKKFGSRSILALKRLEEAGLLHQYPQLIETGKGKVAQAEHTIILTDKEKIITTL